MNEFVIKYAKLLKSEVVRVTEVLKNRGYKPHFSGGKSVFEQVNNWFLCNDTERINLFICPIDKVFGYSSNLDYHESNEVIIVDSSERLSRALDDYDNGKFEGLTNYELSKEYGDVFTDSEGMSQSYHHSSNWKNICDKVPFPKKIDISELSLDELEDLKEAVETRIDEKKKPTQVIKPVLVDVRDDISRTKPNLDFVVALLDEDLNIIYFRKQDMGRNVYLDTDVSRLRAKYIIPELLNDTEKYVGFDSTLNDMTILGEVAE